MARGHGRGGPDVSSVGPPAVGYLPLKGRRAGKDQHDGAAGDEAAGVAESRVRDVLTVEAGDRGGHGDDRGPCGELPGDLVEFGALLVELRAGYPVDAVAVGVGGLGGAHG